MKNDDKVLLAVSGGLDSMVMAELFLAEGMDIAIAHCNFGLRGEESDGDEAFVMKWAEENNVNCYVKAFDLEDGSVQIEARNARYQWFRELLVEHHIDKLATAHHLNDSLETVLINLTRGSGIRGISGISMQNEKIIRPLLFASKAMLHQYAMDEQLDWREDSSNQHTDYDRNLIRLEVIPELKKLNPSLERTFLNTSERLSFAAEIVLQKVEEVKDKYLRKEKNGWKLEIHWIDQPSDELILSEILSDYGVNYATAKEIFAARGKSGKSFQEGEWLITMDRAAIFFDRREENLLSEFRIEGTGNYVFNGTEFLVESVERDDVRFDSVDIAFFDATKFSFPIIIRQWNEGDRFNPLGMQGEKKVSDLLIDEKVPVSKKRHIKIIESGNEIAWVVGYRMSERFKLTDSTQEIIRISVS